MAADHRIRESVAKDGLGDRPQDLFGRGAVLVHVQVDADPAVAGDREEAVEVAWQVRGQG